MRQIYKSLTVFIGLAIAGSLTIYAQTPQDQEPAHHQMRGRGPNAQFETRMLTKRLNLTSEQAAQVEPILAERQERMKALMPAKSSQPSTKPDFKAMHEQRKAIMDDTQVRLDAILTPEQKQQMTEMHQRQFQGGPRGNWGSKPGTAPAA